MNISKLLLFTALILGYEVINAQQQALQLAYDDTGNRYLRHIITVGTPPPPPDYKTDSTAIGNALFDTTLKVFPNPVVADLNITSSVEIENATLFLYNTNGQLVYQQVYNGFTVAIQDMNT